MKVSDLMLQLSKCDPSAEVELRGNIVVVGDLSYEELIPAGVDNQCDLVIIDF